VTALVRYTDNCIAWRGRINPTGYGVAHWSRRYGNVRAHRLTFVAFVGPIPTGLVLDHLCRNRACVNPDHLEIVTGRENTMRGEGLPAQLARRTHCNNGHAYSGDNLAVVRNVGGWRRVCKVCRRERQNARNARLRGAA
jgi:hypothetical protein